MIKITGVKLKKAKIHETSSVRDSDEDWIDINTKNNSFSVGITNKDVIFDNSKSGFQWLPKTCHYTGKKLWLRDAIGVTRFVWSDEPEKRFRTGNVNRTMKTSKLVPVTRWYSPEAYLFLKLKT